MVVLVLEMGTSPVGHDDPTATASKGRRGSLWRGNVLQVLMIEEEISVRGESACRRLLTRSAPTAQVPLARTITTMTMTIVVVDVVVEGVAG